jgi:hypothetical protein
MRTIALFFGGLLHLATGQAAPAGPACSVESQTYDSKTVLCVIAPGESPRRFEFMARFSGGHDDTSASIETFLDGQALGCDADSKKSLFGEDGDVKLFCRFAVSAPSPSESRLKATIRWNHAQYTDYQLTER